MQRDEEDSVLTGSPSVSRPHPQPDYQMGYYKLLSFEIACRLNCGSALPAEQQPTVRQQLFPAKSRFISSSSVWM